MDEVSISMVEKSVESQIIIPSGEVIAENVSPEEYMEKYAALFCEYVRGYVVKMSPVHKLHNDLTKFFVVLFELYFSKTKLGVIQTEPFVMKLSPKIRREPDLMVILNDNVPNLKPTFLDGPADICIEVVSPESKVRDHSEKLEEYEQGGVTEYWILDARLSDAGHYVAHQTINGDYRTPLLPDFALNVPTLWQEQLPDAGEIVTMVDTMMQTSDID